MNVPANLERATLTEYKDDFTDVKPGGHSVEVQFNPESLKLSFANQVAPGNKPGDMRGGAAQQFVGAGSTKLTLALWFDVTAPPHESKRDVRELTRSVGFFITPGRPEVVTSGAGADQKQDTIYRPPIVGFGWGTFLFVGLMDSLEENLEYWSADGRPLRANLSLSMSKQAIRGDLGQAGKGSAGAGIGLGASAGIGTTPLTPSPSGATIQGLADAAGRGGSWQAIASANGIENPRALATGQLIDLRADVRASVRVGVR